MQYILALPTLITVLALFYMGFVVIRNGQSLANKLFLAFIFIDSLWLLSVWVINSSMWGLDISWSRFAFAISIALTMALHGFTNTLLSIKHTKLYKFIIFGIGSLVLLLTLFTETVIKGVHINFDELQNPSPFPEYGTLFLFFVAYLLANLAIFFLMILRHARMLRRAQDAKAPDRRQIRIVALGFIGFVAISLLTNLILPTIVSNAWPSQFAPIGSLVLTIAFFRAIMRYQLFDIRTAVIRSTTYLFLIGILALVFVSAVNLSGALVAAFEGQQALQPFINAMFALAIAVAFNPLKLLFNKITNRFFFRDAYDPQALIDQLNQISATNIELAALLTKAAQLISKNVKAEYCIFSITETEFRDRLIIGTTHQAIDQESMKQLAQLTSQLPSNAVVTEHLALGQKDLKRLLTTQEIAVFVKIAPSPSVNQKGLGYLVLGQKKSGNPYNKQDVQLLETLSKALLIAIQNALRFEEIHAFNKTLQHRVDEATAKLRRSNAKLKQLDEAKDEFISMASHQLRTPLTSVKGYLSMVLEGDAGDLQPGQKKLLEEAYSGAQRMVYLIADFLNVSRLKTGKFVLEYSKVNLAHLIGEELGHLTATAESRQLRLHYEAPEVFPEARLDENKIRQVVMNLIDNAIFYSKPSGVIKVELLSDDQHITFKVKDTGIGVPASEQKDLFEKFFRASNARKVRPDGTGIGLFMIKKVILAHGGSIIFHSVEGKGSTFGFSLPLKAQPRPSEIKGESLQQSGK
ncbi:MAG TPA: ATP-binding protein [Candidatus Saccharimonadales bacterium]